MRLLTLLSALLVTAAISSGCTNNKKDPDRYKGKLAIKAICANYTIEVIDGNINKEWIDSSWVDDVTKKSYSNVFGLSSPCNFPGTIKEGDEFYFKIDSTTEQNCAVCMAYYPTPPKKLSIKVVE